MLVPKTRDTNTLSYTGYQNDASTDLSFITVTDTSASPWATTAVQTFPAPFKVVHTSNCLSAPSLELQLNTNIAGSLTVNGVDLVDAISTISAFRLLKCNAPSASAATGQCLTNVGNDVQMANCNLDHDNRNWGWYGRMLRHRLDGSEGTKCMLRQDDDTVVPVVCSNDAGYGSSVAAASMYFTFTGETINNDQAGTSKCLQCGAPNSNDNVGVSFATCDGSNYQKWRWWAPGDSWTAPWSS